VLSLRSTEKPVKPKANTLVRSNPINSDYSLEAEMAKNRIEELKQ